MSDRRFKAGPVTRPAVGMAPAVVRLARLQPERVRAIRFRRTRVGRRGLVEEQVYAFVRRVVDELIARDAAEDGLREENARLKQALRDWQSRQAGSRRH
ncbi:DivIVA domain-containing protein [Micromonospora sp. NPDC003197]